MKKREQIERETEGDIESVVGNEKEKSKRKEK